MKKILIKNTSNNLYQLLSHKSYISWFKHYIQYILTKNITFNSLIKNHFLFIHYWYKHTIPNFKLYTNNKLLYFYNNFILTIHNGVTFKKLPYIMNTKTIINNKLNFCGEYIFTRKFFTFKQLQPRTSYKITKKKRNRQVNKLKKIIKLK